MTNAVSAAECALYAVLLLPVLFLIVRHGAHGFTGWLFLSLFCVLRIVGGGMSVDNSKPEASIISNVGLSPILLAAAGILHEARLYRIHNINQKAEWAFALLYHFPVVVGVALTAVGSSKLQSRDPSTDMEKAEQLVKAGMAILTVTWAILVVWTALSFTAARARNAEKVRAGTVLLWSIAFSLVFIGIRVFYSLVTLTTRKAYLNPTTGALPIRVILGFLPELIATIAFVAAGLSTQSASKLASEEESYDYTIPNKPQSAPWV